MSGEKIQSLIRKHHNRWKVTLIVASQTGLREQHASAEVNAPEQISAAATALAYELDHIKPARWSEVHILIEPLLPTDLRKPVTEEDLVNRAEKSPNQ